MKAEIKAKADKIVADLNALLSECGMPVGQLVSPEWNAKVGCKFCEYGRSFHVWLPKAAQPVIAKVINTFKLAGFADVGSSVDPCNDKFVQIDAFAP